MTCVLVIDDDESIVEMISLALEDQGYEVVAAVNSAALLLARTRHPDVILLDLNMPGMDGVELSHRLRADPNTAVIPIIAMSAQDRLRATRDVLPVDDRLPKPFDLRRLYELVALWAPPQSA